MRGNTEAEKKFQSQQSSEIWDLTFWKQKDGECA